MGPSPRSRLAAPLRSQLLRREDEASKPFPSLTPVSPARRPFTKPALPPPFSRLEGPARRRAQQPPAAPHPPAPTAGLAHPANPLLRVSRAVLPIAGQGNAQWVQLSRAAPAPTPRSLPPQPPVGMGVPGEAAVPPLALSPQPGSTARENSACGRLVRPSVRLSVRPLLLLGDRARSPSPPPRSLLSELTRAAAQICC